MLNINSTDHVSTTNTNSDFLYVPATDQLGIDPNIIKYNSLITSNIKPPVNPFIAGLKVTMLFTSRKSSSCVQFSSRHTKWWVVGSKKR